MQKTTNYTRLVVFYLSKTLARYEMTEQEYIEIMDNSNFLIDSANPYDMEIKKALEKQIPRELTDIRKVKEYDGYDMGNCPICGEPLDNSFYEKIKYCFVCGQSIKWND